MGIRVSYGDRSGISAAIESGVIPEDSFIIGTYGNDEAELMFYDKHTNIRHIVAQTRFDSKDEAIAYAISHSEVGNTVTVLEDSVYTAYVVQPDFSLKELGMGKFRPETIEELVSGVAKLNEDVTEIKGDIDGLKTETAALADEVTAVKGAVESLEASLHTHENKALLDSITEERMIKWDTGIADTERLPVATDEDKGAVRSTTKENGVSVAEDGTMEVNSLSVDKLMQEVGSTIIMRCGSATE